MTKSIIFALEAKLGKERVVKGEFIKERYEHIWQMDKPLRAKVVVLPKTTQDVSETLKICSAFEQPVVIHGGLTNLVGSTQTLANEVVISLEKMNLIEEVDEKSRTMTVQAGVILANIQHAAQENDLLFPLNFGASGSAQIGGVISTNAGGLRVFRYGMTRHLILGLEVVLADGTIVSAMKKIIKDNSAYDIKQLFIGSEGTLGIVTRAVLKLSEAPRSRNSAFVGFNEYDRVVDFLKYMDRGLAGTLSGFELIWKPTYEAMTKPSAKVKPPLPYDYRYYVLLESLGSEQENDHRIMEELLGKALEDHLILDAVMAHTASDLNWFWTIREDASVLVASCRNVQYFDVSLPIGHIGTYVDQVLKELNAIPEVNPCFPFGHVADGNIHFILGKSNDSTDLISQVNEVIYKPLSVIGGSISAEHGIGVHKKAYLHLSRSPAEIQLMQTLKLALDPKRILNRSKVIDLPDVM